MKIYQSDDHEVDPQAFEQGQQYADLIAYGREMFAGQHTKDDAITTAHSYKDICDFYEGCGYGLAERKQEDTPERKDEDRPERGQDNGGKGESEPRPKGA